MAALFCRDDEDPVAFAALVAVKRAETSMELLDEDLSRIGRALTGGKPFDLRDDYDRRANETLKALITAARAAPRDQSLVDDLRREVSAALAVIPVDNMAGWVVEVRSYLRAWKAALNPSEG